MASGARRHANGYVTTRAGWMGCMPRAASLTKVRLAGASVAKHALDCQSVRLMILISFIQFSTSDGHDDTLSSVALNPNACPPLAKR